VKLNFWIKIGSESNKKHWFNSKRSPLKNFSLDFSQKKQKEFLPSPKNLSFKQNPVMCLRLMMIF